MMNGLIVYMIFFYRDYYFPVYLGYYTDLSNEKYCENRKSRKAN